MSSAIICDTCERIGYIKEVSGAARVPDGWEAIVPETFNWNGLGKYGPTGFKWVDAHLGTIPDPLFQHRCPSCARADRGEEQLIEKIRAMIVKELDARGPTHHQTALPYRQAEAEHLDGCGVYGCDPDCKIGPGR